MNFPIYIFYMFIYVFGIWACQGKEQAPKTESITKSPELMISSVSYGADPEAEKWYEYDEHGNIIRQGMSIDTLLFDYGKNKIIKRHLNKKLSWDVRTDYTTDSVGRVISSVIYDENDQEISSLRYLYDNQGYLIRTLQQTIASGVQYANDFVYESGNLKEVKSYNADGCDNTRYVYKYYLDQPNVLNLCFQQIFDDMLPNDRLGKLNKNMVSQLANISKEGDTLSLMKYKYQMIEGDSMMRCVQSDVLNEFDTDVIYRLKKR